MNAFEGFVGHQLPASSPSLAHVNLERKASSCGPTRCADHLCQPVPRRADPEAPTTAPRSHAAAGVSSRSKNQQPPARGERHRTRLRARRAVLPPSEVPPLAVRAAISAIVGYWNKRAGLKSSPASRARAAIWMLRIESTPSSNRLSFIPTRSHRNTSAATRASSSSAGLRGATYSARAVSAAGSGAGSALRSILPFGVSGNRSRTTNAAGTM